jgi:RNA polymerase sigma factor (sigma-70 family)
MNTHLSVCEREIFLKNLITKAVQGDAVSFKSVYNSIADKMFAICKKYTKSAADAEDCFQDGSIKFYRYLHAYKGEGSFEAWVQRIFINTCKNHLSRSKPIAYDITAIEYLPETQTTALDNLYEKDLVRLINSLPPRQLAIFNLHHNGFKVQELQQYMGIELGSVKSQLYRAKFELQSRLS